MAVDGFWTIQFQGMQGADAGVGVFTKGKIFGGDSGYTYTGFYEGDPDIKAKSQCRASLLGYRTLWGGRAIFNWNSVEQSAEIP
jgi:hypothetical protein